MFYIVAQLAGLLLAAIPALGQASGLVGTWSSGSQAVQTGPGFANPSNMSFTYPKTAGISYSFTADNYFEIARYRFVSNGTQPTCITGVMRWVHGNYTVNADNSINMTAWTDGFQQIQDPCAAISNFVEPWSAPEYYTGFALYTDPTTGQKLHLWQFDGAPLAPLFQVAASPNMLPTRVLRNETREPAVTTSDGLVSSTKRALPSASGAERQWVGVDGRGLVLAAIAIALAAATL